MAHMYLLFLKLLPSCQHTSTIATYNVIIHRPESVELQCVLIPVCHSCHLIVVLVTNYVIYEPQPNNGTVGKGDEKGERVERGKEIEGGEEGKGDGRAARE